MSFAIDPTCVGVLVNISPAPGLQVGFVFGFVLKLGWGTLGCCVLGKDVLGGLCWDGLCWVGLCYSVLCL